MNSLILVLFLGATVALAEIHVENDPKHKAPRPIVKKCMEKCGIKPTMPGELADEENDHGECIKECLEEHKPSKRPSPRPPRPSGVSPRPPRSVLDEDCIQRKVLCSASYQELLAFCA